MQPPGNTRRVNLIFKDMYALWSFVQMLKSKSVEINSKHNSLICDCTPADMETAVLKFGAKAPEELQVNL